MCYFSFLTIPICFFCFYFFFHYVTTHSPLSFISNPGSLLKFKFSLLQFESPNLINILTPTVCDLTHFKHDCVI